MTAIAHQSHMRPDVRSRRRGSKSHHAPVQRLELSARHQESPARSGRAAVMNNHLPAVDIGAGFDPAFHSKIIRDAGRNRAPGQCSIREYYRHRTARARYGGSADVIRIRCGSLNRQILRERGRINQSRGRTSRNSARIALAQMPIIQNADGGSRREAGRNDTAQNKKSPEMIRFHSGNLRFPKRLEAMTES